MAGKDEVTSSLRHVTTAAVNSYAGKLQNNTRVALYVYIFYFVMFGTSSGCNVYATFYGTFLFGGQLWLCLNVAWNQPTTKVHFLGVRVVMRLLSCVSANV